MDERVPIPAGLGGGSTAPLPQVDDALLRDALAVVLMDYGVLASKMHGFVSRDALTRAPRAELEDLGRALAEAQQGLGYAVTQVRVLYATHLAAVRIAP